MRKLLLVVAICSLTVCPAWAFDTDYSKASAVKTADANAILSGAGYLYGLLVATDGTNACVFKVYDALTATGTKVVPDLTITSGAADRVQHIVFDPPVALSTGLSIDITLGAGAVAYTAYYREKF